GRSGWTGQNAVGITWGGDQASDFWSLRVLVVATMSAACSGVSNWSHDIGGGPGHPPGGGCPPPVLLRRRPVRWLSPPPRAPRPDAGGALATTRGRAGPGPAVPPGAPGGRARPRAPRRPPPLAPVCRSSVRCV